MRARAPPLTPERSGGSLLWGTGLLRGADWGLQGPGPHGGCGRRAWRYELLGAFCRAPGCSLSRAGEPRPLQPLQHPLPLPSTCQKGRWACTQSVCHGTCTIYGNGHYITFDGKYYDFDGHCSYVAVQVRPRAQAVPASALWPLRHWPWVVPAQ